MRAFFLAMALGIGVPWSCCAIAGENAVPVPGDKPEAVGGLQLLLEKRPTWEYFGMSGGAKVHVYATKPVDAKGEMIGLAVKPLDRKDVKVTTYPGIVLKNVGNVPLRLVFNEMLPPGEQGWRIALRAVGPDGKEVPAKKQPEPAAPATKTPKANEPPPARVLEPGKDWRPACGPLLGALDFPGPGKYTLWLELTVDPVPGDDKAWSGKLRSNRMEWEVRKAEGQDAAPTK